VILGPLYHWSPVERRESIKANGLRPGSPAMVASVELEHVCLGFDPASTWAISGAMDFAEADDWDLWLVHLGEHDSVSVRSEFGPRLQEVKVRNVIPPDRLWYVGQRRR
jgi:hypothetical protein